MSVYPELDKLNLPKLIACFQKTVPEDESDSIYFDEVALLIRQQSKAGIDFLI